MVLPDGVTVHHKMCHQVHVLLPSGWSSHEVNRDRNRPLSRTGKTMKCDESAILLDMILATIVDDSETRIDTQIIEGMADGF